MFPDSQSMTYVNATINFVDTVNNVFDAISQDGLRFITNCQYLKINVDASGEIHHPCSGDTCVIKLMPDGSSNLEKIYTVTPVDSDGVPTLDLGPYSKYMPGDKLLIAKGGAFLGLLRNGLTKIGVTPLCQMIFMKIESYTRWISRNIEILASGFRFYSVNVDGENTTRLSIFLQDAMNSKMKNASSLSSDYEIVAQGHSLALMYGPKDSNGNRINATTIDMVNSGALFIDFTDPKTGKLVRELMFTPDGSSSDTIYNNDTAIYEKTINNLGDVVSVLEKISGDYTVIVEGHYGITALKDVNLNGNNVNSVAVISHSIQAPATLHDTDVKI